MTLGERQTSVRNGRLETVNSTSFNSPLPIVSVIEGAQKNDLSPVELALPDGIVFVDGAETLWGHLTISPRTIIAGSPDGITSGISGLLAEIASIPADELVSQRRTRLASITLS